MTALTASSLPLPPGFSDDTVLCADFLALGASVFVPGGRGPRGSLRLAGLFTHMRSCTHTRSEVTVVLLYLSSCWLRGSEKGLQKKQAASSCYASCLSSRDKLCCLSLCVPTGRGCDSQSARAAGETPTPSPS